MAEKKYNNPVFEASQALSNIIEKYSWIKTSDIEIFAPVYYPIAIIEMFFDEQSFEDFEIIQLSVLRFANVGILDPNIISASMGINNPNYIYNVLQLLRSYGHINNSGITELGRSSLNEKKKITLSRVKQQFQLDALNANLLKIDQNLIASSLTSPNDTLAIIGHLNYLDGVPTEYVERQIRKVGFDHFKKNRSSILNTNVMTIHDMHCVEIRYSKCYLLKTNYTNVPLIFGKKYNAIGDSEQSRFFWQPLSFDLGSSLLAKYLNNENIPSNSEVATNYINQLTKALKERSSNIDSAEETRKALRKWNNGFSISDSQVIVHSATPSRCAVVNVNHTNFTKFNGALLSYLDSLSRSDEFILSSPRLYGKIISVITKDKYILNTVAAYRELRKAIDAATIVQKTRAYIFDNSLENLQGEKLFRALFEFFKNLYSMV